jgi:hypothetical protein
MTAASAEIAPIAGDWDVPALRFPVCWLLADCRRNVARRE